MIPLPKLDDRSAADLLEEALQLAPRYCPEWTNRSPSDPGMAILELVSWMGETLLGRLNRVPEKSYLAFLNLLGITLRPAQPATTVVRFNLVDGALHQIVRAGTQVATASSESGEPILFETDRDLVVTNVQLDRCISFSGTAHTDNSALLSMPSENGFAAFGGSARAERYLYLGDSQFASLRDDLLLRLRLATPENGGRDLVRLLGWEYWNGKGWRDLSQSAVEIERGEIAFVGPTDFVATAVNGKENHFVRGRLEELPLDASDTEVSAIGVALETIGDGVAPDHAFANVGNSLFTPLDLGMHFRPFGNQPKVDHCFYFGSQRAFGLPGAAVRIEFAMAEAEVAPAPVAASALITSWEYFDETKWRVLGRSAPSGVIPRADDAYRFSDTTNAFTRSGAVSFQCPADFREGEVNGKASYWLRARIEGGDYGVPGSYLLDGERWVWRDVRPLRPPMLRRMAIDLRSSAKPIEDIFSYNDFRFRDHSAEACRNRPLFPFAAMPDDEPALYFGWNGRLPEEPIAIYIEGASSEAPAKEDQAIIWECWTEEGWRELEVRDETARFTRAGFVEFTPLPQQALSSKFSHERYWIRARLEIGGYAESPHIGKILSNAVDVANRTTIRDELLGSGDGSPMQTFRLLHDSVLSGEEIEILEEDLAAGASSGTQAGGAGRSAAWTRVENFVGSDSSSRHYVFDAVNGEVQFGDGVRGRVVPSGQNNVVARRYTIGGGRRGNVAPNTITTLSRSLAYIESVTNPIGGSGGADAESIDEAKKRAPLELKTLDRAITADDYETLALRASTSVARAKCLSDEAGAGGVRLVVLPKSEDAIRVTQPSPELLRLVKRYLDERRPIGTRLEVVHPCYRAISIRICLARKPLADLARIRTTMDDLLRNYLHPLHGSFDGEGWPFGEALHKSDLLRVIEVIPGVARIHNVELFDESRAVHCEVIDLKPDELLSLVQVTANEFVDQGLK